MRFFITVVLIFIFSLVYPNESVRTLQSYIIKVHDKSTKGNPKITRKRAFEYASAIIDGCNRFEVPVNVAVGMFEWESGFENVIDKKGSCKKELPIKFWCYGLGKLKIETANDMARLLGYNRFVTGRDLLYNYQENIELSVRYLRYCMDMKNGDVRRALDSYKAGPRGETKGWANITVTHPSKKVVKGRYSEFVFECVERYTRYEVNYESP